MSRRELEISRQCTHLLNALASSDIEIGELSLRGIKTSVWPGVLQLRQESYCAGLTALKTITLESSCISGHSHNSANRHCEVKTLGILLEGAHNLQTLTLHREARPHILTDFLMCFRPSLPKLSNLCLFGIATSDQNLIDTLLACRATLARLDLSAVRLAHGNTVRPTGSWHHFFCRVSESLPCLHDIRLAILQVWESEERRSWRTSDSRYLKAVKHAILGRTAIPQPTSR